MKGCTICGSDIGDIKLIEELGQIRMRITEIYMILGNPNDCAADMILKSDIEKFKILKKSCAGQSSDDDDNRRDETTPACPSTDL